MLGLPDVRANSYGFITLAKFEAVDSRMVQFAAWLGHLERKSFPAGTHPPVCNQGIHSGVETVEHGFP
jgi:hypothetical protein